LLINKLMDNGSNADRKIKALLSSDELAEYLGISVSTVYRLVESRQIPFYKLGRGLRFKQEDISKFIDDNRTDTMAMQLYERKKKI
jgi:excisionase family DNA binding protein